MAQQDKANLNRDQYKNDAVSYSLQPVEQSLTERQRTGNLT
jgi:hypothetical protein